MADKPDGNARGSWPHDRTGESRLSTATVAEALRQAAAIKSVAAQKLGISRSYLYDYIRAHPDLEDVIADVEEQTLDLAETQLVKALGEGDGQSVRFYLKTKGKNRGYTERVESTGPEGGPQVHRLAPALDMSAYTDAELATLEALLEKGSNTR